MNPLVLNLCSSLSISLCLCLMIGLPLDVSIGLSCTEACGMHGLNQALVLGRTVLERGSRLGTMRRMLGPLLDLIGVASAPPAPLVLRGRGVPIPTSPHRQGIVPSVGMNSKAQ
jgi:hypothetical protein